MERGRGLGGSGEREVRKRVACIFFFQRRREDEKVVVGEREEKRAGESGRNASGTGDGGWNGMADGMFTLEFDTNETLQLLYPIPISIFKALSNLYCSFVRRS